MTQQTQTYRPGIDEIATDSNAKAYLTHFYTGNMQAHALAYFKELRSPDGGFPLHYAVAMVVARMEREKTIQG